MPSDNTEQRKLAAIMFTDMVGYSALTQRDEALALALLREHHDILRDILPMFQGNEIKSTGDGLLIEFSSALAAVQCAIEIQRSLAERNEKKPGDRQILIRIGIHLGDVVWRGNDVLGDGVNIAARIEPLADPGGICVTRAVFEQIENKVSQSCIQLSKPELKNISANVEVYKLVLDDVRPLESVTRAKKKIAWAMLLVVAVNLFLFLRFGLQSKRATTGNAPSAATVATNLPDQKSVAVLPFVNMSADKADEYLSDGMTEELLNVLAKVKGLRVPGRSSSFAFKGKSEEGIFRRVGEQLHVGSVLEGSVRKAGDKLRITAQLIKVADGFHLWSETYDRDMTNIFAIQSDIAARVAEALKIQLLGTVQEPTRSIEAYNWYLKGRYLWNRRTGESLVKAVDGFNQAIALDPGYALAYAGLADCYALLPNYGKGAPVEAQAKARAAALKALQLDSRLAEPLATLAACKSDYDWDWPGAEADFRRAIELDPNYPTARQWFAEMLSFLGRSEEALTQARKALELDPLSPVINVVLSQVLTDAGRADEGIELLRKQVAADPSFAIAHAALGDAYLTQGKLVEAIAEYGTASRLDNANRTLGALGICYAKSGRSEDAKKVLQQLMEFQRQGSDLRVAIALLQHVLGNDQQAFESLERAAAEHSSQLQYISVDPLWKDLRPQPRFQALLKKMNLAK